MIYMRGQARDYDAWAELTGDDAWSWENALPDFIAHESHWRMDAGGDPGFARFHGGTGELRVERQRLRWDILEAFVAACVEAGIPRAGRLQRRRQRGRRLLRGEPAAAAGAGTRRSAFLKPVAARRNLVRPDRGGGRRGSSSSAATTALACTGVVLASGEPARRPGARWC